MSTPRAHCSSGKHREHGKSLTDRSETVEPVRGPRRRDQAPLSCASVTSTDAATGWHLPGRGQTCSGVQQDNPIQTPPNCVSSGRFNQNSSAESQFVAWVGATCVLWAHPVARLGHLHPGSQQLHPSAQRQSAKLWRNALAGSFRAEAEVPEVCQTCARKDSLCMAEKWIHWGESPGLPRPNHSTARAIRRPDFQVTVCSAPSSAIQLSRKALRNVTARYQSRDRSTVASAGRMDDHA